jgi:hypothetical protein
VYFPVAACTCGLKEEYSTMEIFNVSYVALHFCLSVLDDRIYVFHV